MSGLNRRTQRSQQRAFVADAEKNWSVAVHMAGHVVVFELTGLPYEYVTLSRMDDSSGHVILRETFDPSRDHAVTRRMVMGLTAGALAQWVLLDLRQGKRFMDGARSDLAEADSLLRTISDDPHSINPLVRETLELLRGNPHTVKAVAEALVAHETLTRHEVRVVLHAALA